MVVPATIGQPDAAISPDLLPIAGEVIHTELQNMLATNVICPDANPIVTPVFVLSPPAESRRLCVEFTFDYNAMPFGLGPSSRRPSSCRRTDQYAPSAYGWLRSSSTRALTLCFIDFRLS